MKLSKTSDKAEKPSGEGKASSSSGVTWTPTLERVVLTPAEPHQNDDLPDPPDFIDLPEIRRPEDPPSGKRARKNEVSRSSAPEQPPRSFKEAAMNLRDSPLGMGPPPPPKKLPVSREAYLRSGTETTSSKAKPTLLQLPIGALIT